MEICQRLGQELAHIASPTAMGLGPGVSVGTSPKRSVTTSSVSPTGDPSNIKSAVTQAEHAISIAAGILHMVEIGDDGDPSAGGNALQSFHHQRPIHHVKAGHWLIGQDDLWFLGQDFGDRDALLFASGERVSALPDAVKKPDMIEAAQRHLVLAGIEIAAERCPAPPTGEMRQPANQHVIEHAQTPHQVELLVDHPHPGSVSA